MSYKIFGIASSEGKDRDGEIIKLDGMDTSNFNFLKDEHQDNFFATIGKIVKAKKIFKEKDCNGWREEKCWKQVNKPFLYFEAELFQNHPNATAAMGVIDTLTREGIGHIKASIEGGCKDRQDNILKATVAHSVVLTVQPVNKDCLVFPFLDVKKSAYRVPLTPEAKNRVDKIKAQIKKDEDFYKSLNVAKSIVDNYIEIYKKSLTEIECQYCKSKYTYSDIDEDAPNVCGKCRNYFTMSDFAKALKKKGD